MLILKLLTIAKYTFKEIVKSNIFYVTLIMGIALIVVTYVATEFTYGVPQKVAMDFGTGMLSLSSLGIAVFMGATLLPKEIDSRTVYMVISRPVPRYIFISGKILGLIGVLVLNILILSSMTLVAFKLLGGVINGVILFAIVFNLLEAVLLLLLVVFFSVFANPILSTIISLLIFTLGHAVKETLNTLFVQDRPALKIILEFSHLVLPGFYKLNLKDFIGYETTIDASYIQSAALYGFSYSLFLFFLIIYFFNKKNLD